MSPKAAQKQKHYQVRSSNNISLVFLLVLLPALVLILSLIQENQTYRQQAQTSPGCGAPGDAGNEKGVGKYCTKGGGQCKGLEAAVCPQDIDETFPGVCSKGCTTDADCGTGATCYQDALGKGCKPNACQAPTATTAPTATPIPTATLVPTAMPTATPIPTETPVPTSKPTATPTPTVEPTATPTPIIKPTATLIPTTRPIEENVPTIPPVAPSAMPSVVATTVPVVGGTTLSFTVFLHGIGGSGDTTNAANSLSNKSPQRMSREFSFEISDENQTIQSQTGVLMYNSGTGSYIGVMDLGDGWTSGDYFIKIGTQSFLEKTLSSQTIAAGGQITVPIVNLAAGDLNEDGVIDALDYNGIIDCFGLSAPTAICDETKKQQADLNDDSKVDGIDYNLLLREMRTQQ